MRRYTFHIFTVLMSSTAAVQAQGLLETIRTPEKAIATVNQSLEGTWLMELRRPGQSASQPPILNLITFQPDGTAIASSGDGAQTTGHGVWARVGDRKFLQTMFVFNFNESRAL